MIAFLGRQRIVLKYGTSSISLIERDGSVAGLDYSRIEGIAAVVASLYSAGKGLILVSSGAIVAGMELNGIRVRPSNVRELQDLAAEGQLPLMEAYRNVFAGYGLGIIPMLVTSGDFNNEKKRSNIRERVERGFKKRKICIFNTNDALTNEEIASGRYRFTDNDPLAGYVAEVGSAESFIIVSEGGSGVGSGGADSKVKAFERAKSRGIATNKDYVVTHSMLEEIVLMRER